MDAIRHDSALPSPGAGWSRRAWTLGLLALALAILLVRARFIGNPNIDADEQFYLLTGDRLLRGTLPYVDIWDRKPIGLFLLFAGMRLLGGDGVLAYQLVAAASVVATAILIAMMARRIATPPAALAVAFAYAPLLGLSGGQGGQSPVFYNLPVALAVWLVLEQAAPLRDAPSRRSTRVTGIGAMLLIGLAIQIKYNAVFEGIYLGLALLAIAWRNAPRLAPRLLDATLWITAALLPTLLALLAYAALGHGRAFVYANFTSIFARGHLSAHEQFHNVGHILGRIAPVLVLIILIEGPLRRTARWQANGEARAAHHFLLGWLLASVAGIALFGTYFNHYVLPALPPLLAIAAPALAIRRRVGSAILTTLLLASTTIWYGFNSAKVDRHKGDGAYAYALASRIRPMLGGRCLFIFYNEPIFYHLTNSCLPTRWPFPYHLSLTREAASLGVDPHAELARIMATRPSVVLTKVSDDPEISQPMLAQLTTALHRDYRLVYVHRFQGSDPDTDEVWQRLPGR